MGSYHIKWSVEIRGFFLPTFKWKHSLFLVIQPPPPQSCHHHLAQLGVPYRPKKINIYRGIIQKFSLFWDVGKPSTQQSWFRGQSWEQCVCVCVCVCGCFSVVSQRSWFRVFVLLPFSTHNLPTCARRSASSRAAWSVSALAASRRALSSASLSASARRVAAAA